MSDLAAALLDSLDDDALARLAERMRPYLHEHHGDADDGYLTPEAAGRYLGVSRKRIYDLTSMRAIEPDGRDGRTPLYTRATLDAYVRGRST